MGAIEEWRWQERVNKNEDRAVEIVQSEQQRKKNELKKKMKSTSRAWGIITKNLTFMSSESQKAEKKCGPVELMAGISPIWQKTQAYRFEKLTQPQTR